MDYERIEAFAKARRDSWPNPQAVIHLGGYDYAVGNESDVPEGEMRVIVVFERGEVKEKKKNGSNGIVGMPELRQRRS